MGGMKLPRFSVKTILLVTAAVAITCAGVIGYRSIWSPYFTAGYMPWNVFRYTAPLYVPIAFAAFALGRKKLSVPMIIAFAIAQAMALAVLYLVLQASGRTV
jgi:hypothetical protein